MLDKTTSDSDDNMPSVPAESKSDNSPEVAQNDQGPQADIPQGRSGILTAFRSLVQFLLMAAVLAGAFIAMERLVASREEPQKRGFRQQAFTVESQSVTRANHRPNVLVYGQTETARSVDLRALVSGEITAVNPKLAAGARIEEGDFLVEIDRFNYEGAVLEAKANLVQTEAAIREIDARLASEKEQLGSAEDQLELARADLTRAQSLVQSGTLTNKQVDDRVLIVSQREQSVSQRRNNIIIAEAQIEQQMANAERLKWKLDEAERRLDDTKLYAPFSGIISSADAEPGRSVGTNDVVASIYDDSALEAHFTITNAQYGRMALDTDPLIGREIEVIWTIGSEDYKYSGQIDRIGATVAADRGGVQVVALIDPAAHAVQLRPGAFVEIVVPDRAYENAIKVPETAIYDGSRIFIVNEGRLSGREIKILAFDGSNAIIDIADGSSDVINDGDRILVTRLTEANDGVAVRAPGKGRPQGGQPGGGKPRSGNEGETRTGGADGAPQNAGQRRGQGNDTENGQGQNRRSGQNSNGQNPNGQQPTNQQTGN